MAIAFDDSTDGGVVVATSLTFAHTCTGSDRILFVTAFGDNTIDNITGVTYAGDAMTLVASINGFLAVDRWCYLWVLVNPDSGANNVILTSSGTLAIAAHASSYTGAEQTGQPDSFNETSIANNSVTMSTTVVDSNCWLVGSFRTPGTSATVGSGTTQREGSNGLYTADSGGTVGTGSQSLIYNNGAGAWNACIASFSPSGAPPPTGGSGQKLAMLRNRLVRPA